MGDRWLPGFSLEGGIRALSTESSVDSAQRGRFKNDARPVFAYIGGAIHLATPVLYQPLAQREGRESFAPEIRLFGRFGAATSFDGRFRTVTEGSPGGLIIPLLDNDGDGMADAEPPVAAIIGQGSSTGSTSEPLILSASFGADLAFDVRGRRLHIKPSLEWIRQEDEVVGVLGFAEAIDGDPIQCPCRTAFVRVSDREAFNGIGPGLEVELEASRLQDFLMTFYVGAKAFYSLETEIVLNGSAPFSDASGIAEIRSTYERDRWDYQVSTGFRLHWLPE
ncbi:MAG: hypothetical protein AB8G23_20005 [Myxococcota bacterium]